MYVYNVSRIINMFNFQQLSTLSWLTRAHIVSCFSASEITDEDVLQAFIKERKLNGDFISKTSDMLWQKEVLKFEDVSDVSVADVSQEVLVQHA